MTERLPIDEAARLRVRHETKRTLFVSAGAGSGKTRELVQRIVGLVAGADGTGDDGIDLPRIAAITFTNAAASELRDRVREELTRARDGTAHHSELSEGQRARCREALTRIDAASIQTLHSFAQRILALYPMEAGLPPELQLRDEVAASIAFEERWRRFLERLLHEGAGDPEAAECVVRAFTLGMTTDHLRKLAVAFHEAWDRLRGCTFAPVAAPSLDATEILELMAEAWDRLPEVSDTGDDGYKQLCALERTIEKIATSQALLDGARTPDDRAVAEDDLLRALTSQSLKVSKGNRSHWSDTEALKTIKTCTRIAEELRVALLDGLRAAVLPPLLNAVAQFVADYQADRLREGTLEFHDLLVLARDLLRSNPQVRGELARRYAVLLIDEFQDTDPIQAEIAVLIASDDPKAGEKAWADVAVPPGRLFFVGDPKQSIYRFRRAEIDVYLAAMQRFGGQDGQDLVSLSQNFRSTPSVIAFANGLFERLFALDRKQPAVGPAPIQVPLAPLGAWRESNADRPVSVSLIGGPAQRATGKSVELRATEAAHIASVIAGIKREPERWRVFDDERKEWRDARYDDIAILMPSRASLDSLEEALYAAGVPCRIAARSLLFATQEVRDVLNILSAIDDPTDQVAVVAALRAPGFGCSDPDLYRFAMAGGRWDYRSTMPESLPTDDPVVSAMSRLKGLNAGANTESPPLLWSGETPEVRIGSIKRGAFATAGHAAAREREQMMERLEADRLLYVGATRARDHLVASVYFIENKARVPHEQRHAANTCTPAECTWSIAQDMQPLWNAIPMPAPGQPEMPLAPAESTDTAEERDEWSAHRRSLIAQASRRLAIAATRLAAVAQEAAAIESPEETGDAVSEETPWRRGRAGTSIGRAVHAVLQTIDLATGAGLDDAARAQAAAEGVPGREREIAALARAAVTSGPVRAAVESRRFWREVPVGVLIGGVLLEGFIDLLYEGPAGLVVVDYKTDAVRTEAEATEKAERYRLQGAAYALALATALGRPVAGMVFVFLGQNGEVFERVISDLPAAIAEARRLLPTAAAAAV